MGEQRTVLNGKKKAAWLRDCFVRDDTEINPNILRGIEQ
jgi:hypothetical protein